MGKPREAQLDWATLVRTCREAAGMHVGGASGLAARLGVTRETVFRWEAGRSRPGVTDDAVTRFCALFRVSQAEAWGALGHAPPESANAARRPDDPLFREIAEFLEDDRRSAASKEYLIDVVRRHFEYVKAQDPAPPRRRRTA